MRDTLCVLRYEAQRLLWFRWHYKMSVYIQLIVIFVMFLFNTMFVRQATGAVSAGEPGSPMFALIGYLVWYYAMQAVEGMSSSLMQEAQTGTMEQKYLSPTPAGLVLVGNIIGNLIINTGIVAVVGAVLILVFQIHYVFTPTILLVLVLTLVGIYGFGFMLAGFTLVFKQIGPMATLLQYAFMFLNGSLLPVERLPDVVQYVGYSLPSTHGIILLRRLMIDGQTLSDLLADASLATLCVHSAIYLALGVGVYLVCQRQARIKGLLGQY